MKINEVAKKLNISARAIRFYEEKGLISPEKQKENAYRIFNEKDILRLQTIIALREIGIPIQEIKKVLSNMEQKDQREVKHYLDLQRATMYTQWIELKQQLDTIDEMMDRLNDNSSLELEEIFELAEGSKRLSTIRKQWSDQWGFDQLAPSFDQRILDVFPEIKQTEHYEQSLNTAVEWISPNKGEVGLDIGVGTGNFAGKFVSKSIKIKGIDQSKEMLKQCHIKYPQLETKLGNFLAVPFSNNEFDFVISSFTYHHLKDEQKMLALEEVHRILKPHGRVCIVDFMLKDGGTSLSNEKNKQYTNRSVLLKQLHNKDYITIHQQINEFIHIVYGVRR
ncbi:MerR family transcriptional regulator [Chengkuizengella axinellae]|uniref:MerR family transcriptional regulator n=1 Tax=Chengkuizengella axinellae TaxID=3064388 RepID=A0ABT9IZY1_9BACL|nr:MerR family transcriptional regulator [Chengkuizengella sp. 2205SS18-9]MDP5274927.1 MerR family transcriptional regulator [Chengkuizengella sp. 2205SS18-9]